MVARCCEPWKRNRATYRVEHQGVVRNIETTGPKRAAALFLAELEGNSADGRTAKAARSS